MIKFKSEAPEPYHITSRELASMLGKEHNRVLDKIKSYYIDDTEDERIKTTYLDANNQKRTAFHMTVNFAFKIILSFKSMREDKELVKFIRFMFLGPYEDLRDKPDIQLYRPTPEFYKGIRNRTINK